MEHINTLFFGDNLNVLKDIPDESVDLIYLDPPFNSKRDHNILFKSSSGDESRAQIIAFEDTWKWTKQASEEYDFLVTNQANIEVRNLIKSFIEVLGHNDMMAYLVMMATRLLELKRVLKSTGSIYLHCDSSASHYIKILMDSLFGKENFRNEVIWKRTSAHSDAHGYGANTDTILFYTRSENFNFKKVYLPYTDEYKKRFRFKDPDGRRWTDDNLTAKGLSGGGYEYEYKGVKSLWRMPVKTMEQLDKEKRLHFTSKGGIRLKRYLDEMPGTVAQSLWDDIPPLNSQSKERLGYPTQKPIALLERIIEASSNEGDVVLDPFCGCGTAVHAAQKLNRSWIGIDITHLAIAVIEHRLADAFGVQVDVVGVPEDVDGARDLAKRDKYSFQYWACSLVSAFPTQDKKKGGDGGKDGWISFTSGNTHHKIVVSVKGGDNLNPSMVRDLRGVIEAEGSPIGLFICLEQPTKGMLEVATQAGFYTDFEGGKHPRIQILTIQELLAGKTPSYPNTHKPPRLLKRASLENLQGTLFEKPVQKRRAAR